MREPHASYLPVEGRPLAMGDYAVVTYAATLEGKPLGEVVPDAPAQLQGRRNAWIVMDEHSLLPGFATVHRGDGGKRRKDHRQSNCPRTLLLQVLPERDSTTR